MGWSSPTGTSNLSTCGQPIATQLGARHCARLTSLWCKDPVRNSTRICWLCMTLRDDYQNHPFILPWRPQNTFSWNTWSMDSCKADSPSRGIDLHAWSAWKDQRVKEFASQEAWTSSSSSTPVQWNMLPLRDYHSHPRVLALDRPIIDCRRTLIANQHWCTPAPLYEASSSSFRTPWTLRKPRCTSLMLRDRAICHGLNAVRHLLVCEMTSLRRTLMHALYFLNFANLQHGLSYVSRVMALRMLLSVVCRIGNVVQVISLLVDVFLAAFLVQSANIAFCSMLSPGVDDGDVEWLLDAIGCLISVLRRRPRPGHFGCMPSSKDGSRPS